MIDIEYTAPYSTWRATRRDTPAKLLKEIPVLPQILISASAAIVLIVGALHLVFTFYGHRLRPRDPDLETRMKQVSPGITRQTTMWKTWIGFNASHSIGLMLFGVVYGYLALLQLQVLLQSWFLLWVGAVFLLSFLYLHGATSSERRWPASQPPLCSTWLAQQRWPDDSLKRHGPRVPPDAWSLTKARMEAGNASAAKAGMLIRRSAAEVSGTFVGPAVISKFRHANKPKPLLGPT